MSILDLRKITRSQAKLDLRKIVRSQSELFRAKTVLSEGEVALATSKEGRPLPAEMNWSWDGGALRKSSIQLVQSMISRHIGASVC
ncbi:hypothetical protein HY003_00710 [Candidatus Saccharibacteria bacterium]|nr:hypothetical protein [Candidatus Saccharibacteria bacterium]MBI3337803.1 hypothetical protein [Candidatus Saccharibacteria bacterium]